MAAVLLAAALALTTHAQLTPMLFMDITDAAKSPAPWGKLLPRANSLRFQPQYSMPAFNWTGGDTTFAAFEVLGEPGTYEIFVACGRPGEPYRKPARHLAKPPPGPPSADVGVTINRVTTKDFNTWSAPVAVGWLPNGSGGGARAPAGARRYGFEPRDGSVWTAKSIDRNAATGQYLMFASYGSHAHTFTALKPATAHAFAPTTGSLKEQNFEDHDDCNVIFDPVKMQWVDMQIMYELYSAVGLDAKKVKKYCDNVSNDTRRVVSFRTSKDGNEWTQDAGCLDTPQKGEHCKKFNTSALVAPCDCADDPPDLEFYRIRAFRLGKSGRMAAHALDYVPSPRSVVYSKGYGRQPLWYCSHGCCHGPHSYEEWWLGPASGDPTDMKAWRRPFKDTHAAPHDTWLMAQPLNLPGAHLFVDSGKIYGLELYRLAGLYSPGNGEISTPVFEMPSAPLWLNADAMWSGSNHVLDPRGVTNADEGRQAYIQVAVHLYKKETNQTAELGDGSLVPGYSQDNCILTNVSGTHLQLKWNTTAAPIAAGTKVQVRIYFRDATVYAVGSE